MEVAYKLYGEAPKADSVRTLSLSLESGEHFVSFLDYVCRSGAPVPDHAPDEEPFGPFG
ncbi:hypothetical protein [Streptomyces sp. NPDC127084]|uniref:hypothetical protein n=1 Tax=Streptomyces sp. NPDC127084 TaxID=3347133 RepID=UPI00364D4DC5